jgi:hypothetical protein
MVTRRDAAAFIGALGLGASAAPEWRTAKAAEPHALPVSPEEQNDALVRILGRTDEGESVWQSSSKIFALTENGVVPLLETRGGQRSWWRSEDGGIYRRFPAALNYFVDPVTGAFIDEFKNPITGRTTPLVSTVERRKDGEVFTPTGSYSRSRARSSLTCTRINLSHLIGAWITTVSGCSSRKTLLRSHQDRFMKYTPTLHRPLKLWIGAGRRFKPVLRVGLQLNSADGSTWPMSMDLCSGTSRARSSTPSTISMKII